jgi:hypothetical protein
MPRGRLASEATLERKVYFYRPRMAPVDGRVPQLDPEAIFAAVSALAVGNARYQTLEDGQLIRVTPMRTQSRIGLSMGVVRNSGLPRLENVRDGRVSPLEIADGAGLVEETHVLFFENGIIGAEFNFYGPRVGRLVSFIQSKCPGLPRFSTEMLLNDDAAAEVRRLTDLRLVRLRLGRSYVDLLEQAGQSVADSIGAMLDHTEGRSLEIVIKPERGRNRTLSQRALGWVQSIAGMPRTKEGAETFVVRGKDGHTDHVETFDLLRDKLVSSRQVVRQHSRHRGVDPDAMLDEIARAYVELEPAIARAAGLREAGT